MQQDDVKAFYDAFLQSKMLDYRLQGNLRIERALARILPEIREDAAVLDVGCGIGMVTERIARAARKGRVWGVDISDQNVWYAARTVREPNLSFFVADVTGDLEAVAAQIGRPLDVVTLVDVIEHIPEAERPGLLTNLRRLSAGAATLILTYPSPQFQRYLQANKPEELQIIDTVIEPETLLAEARLAGYALKHYSLETVWMPNQYVHCILQTQEALAAAPPASGLGRRVVNGLKHARRRLLLPLRRRRYVTAVFGAGPPRSS